MTKKEYLSQAFELNKDIKRKEIRIDALKSSLGVVATSYDDTRVKTLPHSPFESRLTMIIDLENELKKDKEELENLKMEIWRSIHSIGNNTVETVMELRYIAFENWPEIAEELGYSLSYVFTLHRMGLEAVRVA